MLVRFLLLFCYSLCSFYLFFVTNLFASEALENIPLVSKQTQINRPVIIVGYQPGMGLISNSQSYNEKGYGYDLLVKLGRHINVEFQFVPIVGSIVEALEQGVIDIAGLAAKTPERLAEYAFGNIPVNYIQYALVTKYPHDYFHNDPQSVAGKTVATYPGNPGNASFEAFLKQHNISVQYIQGTSIDFTNIDADFYIVPSVLYSEENFYSVVNLDLKHSFFVSKKGNEALMAYLDKHLYAFFKENIMYHDILSRKYNREDAEFTNRSLTREEHTRLSGKHFKVGYIDNHEPYQSQNTSAEPRGISIAYLNTLAEKYNFTVEYVPYNLDNPWEIHNGLDLLVSLVGRRNFMTKYYDVTDAYEELSMNVVFQEKNTNVPTADDWEHNLPKNITIGLLHYINFPYSRFAKKYPTVTLEFFTKTEDLVNAFLNKQLDAILVTRAGADSIIYSSTQDHPQLVIDMNLEMKFHVSKMISHDYLEIFNVIINKEPKETIKEITVNEIVAYAPDFGPVQFIKQYFYIFVFGVVFFICFTIGGMYIVRQRSALKYLIRDDVTDLPALSQFTKDVNNTLKKANEQNYEIMMLDIDHCKMINTYYGTDKGTQVILSIADALQDAYKNKDVLLTRLVAEQFLIFKKIDDGKNIEDVIKGYVIPRIKTIVGEAYSLNMSVGICQCSSEKKETATTLLDNVRVAHQKAKKTHTTSFEFFTEDMRTATTTTLDVAYRMEHALQNKEFVLYFQPKIDFKTLKIHGAEALVRWIPPIGDPIFPDAFIPVMERNGFISQLELFVFEEMCQMLQRNADVPNMPKIAINISPITLSQTALIKEMIILLKTYRVHPERIEIEITESAIGNFEKSLPDIIKLLHKVGFTVAMDDFGAGNSSLNRLSVINVDVLKLDKVFLDFHEDAPRGSLVVQNIISLGKQLGMKLVAEGIEYQNQAKWLQSLQCDIAQGFYFSKPLPEDEFIALVRKDKRYTLM